MEFKEDLTIKDRILGCMVGGAVGDALGYPVEFSSYEGIVRKFGRPGIMRYELDSRGLAQISDDTQMTLFTAGGCLLGLTRGFERGIMGRLDMYCEHTYADWYFSQTHSYGEHWPGDKHFDTWLMCVPELYARRAPGMTCLSALRDRIEQREPHNDSCGCGGVMRVAPIALISERIGHTDEAPHTAAMAARLTHQHPLGFLPAALLTMIIHEILHNGYDDSAGVRTAALNAVSQLPDIVSPDDDDKTYGALWPSECSKLSELVLKAVDLALKGVDAVDAIPQLGEGWTGHEALAIALYCAVAHADSFEDAVVAAVNHSGDSDSTGSICGQVVGALLGRSRIPAHFTDHLELLDVIEEISEDLYIVYPSGSYHDLDPLVARRWSLKYEHRMYCKPQESSKI